MSLFSFCSSIFLFSLTGDYKYSNNYQKCCLTWQRVTYRNQVFPDNCDIFVTFNGLLYSVCHVFWVLANLDHEQVWSGTGFLQQRSFSQGLLQDYSLDSGRKGTLMTPPRTLVISLVLHNKHSNACWHLSVQDCSYCAWEIVRNEILRALKFILDNTVLFKSSEY